jgi:phage shock protein C
MKRLYRLREDRILAGVCSGLGDYFNIDPVIFRLGFVLITLGWGSGILLYLIMWLIIPLKPRE